jgi:CHASE2 domain-containing sensor protein
MSPEQAELTMQDVDTRTDIYSLGVLLYELLTGRTPFDAEKLLASGLEAMRRTIREQEPERPSTKLSSMLEVELTTTAKHRHTEPPKLIHLLRGDLDWIVMKCLEKDRMRRYETANELAVDLKRHLNTEPVIARPPSIGYKLQKALRRNQLAIAAAVAIIIALAMGAALVQGQNTWAHIGFLAQDWQTRVGAKTPVDNRLVLIGIDGKSFSPHFSDEDLRREPLLKELQSSWPWSRAVWARLLEKLSAAGAKVIVFDLVFSARKDGDDAFHQALDKYKDRVVVGYLADENNTRWDDLKLIAPNSSVAAPAGTNSGMEDERFGYLPLWPDSDGTVRRASCRQTGAQMGDIAPKDAILESLASRALRKFGRPDLVPPGFDTRLFRYTAPANQAYKPEPAVDVLSPKLWEKNYGDGKFFKDKIVIIGPTAEIFHDLHDTPFTNPKLMSGAEIQLQIINAALHGQFLREPSRLANLSIITMFVAMAVVSRFLIRQSGKRFSIVTGLIVAYVIFAQLLFDHAGLVIPLTFPLLALVVSSLFFLAFDLVKGRPGGKK